jgi:hypothetical protein
MVILKEFSNFWFETVIQEVHAISESSLSVTP